MVNLFPSFWELLIPNLTIGTAIGVVVLIISILMFFNNALKKYAILGIIISIILIWGVSIIMDLLNSIGGIIIIFGTIISLIVYAYFFIYKK